LTGGGTATVNVSINGLDSNDFLLGTAGNDTLVGGNGSDVLAGLGGDDFLSGGAGAPNQLIGGQGNDTYYVQSAGDSLIEQPNEGTDVVLTALAVYSIANLPNIENLTGLASSGQILSGNDGDNVVIGGSGDDILFGGLGRDVLVGGAGNDRLVGGDGLPNEVYGGTGNDTYVVTAVGDTLVELAGGGTDTVETNLSSYALLDNFENLIFTGTGDFTGTGNSAANVIVGGTGNDTLIGGAGAANELIGGAGNDTYVVSVAGDSIVEQAGGGTDTVQTSLSVYALTAANVENLTGTSNAGQSLIGNALDNVITGGTGNDEMQGGAGNDTYVVLNAGDTIVEQAGQGTDTIETTLSTYFLTAANVENLTGISASGQTLVGGAIGNVITGGAGNDVLDGGLGADTLIGNAGADSFLFDSALGGGNVDTIQDFVLGSDRVLLDHNVFSALGTGALAPGAFVIGTAAGDADDRIIYDQSTGNLYYDADGNGAGAAVQFATLQGHPALTASDFSVL
jgi:Ca2+-binding RTX toxin-like protein